MLHSWKIEVFLQKFLGRASLPFRHAFSSAPRAPSLALRHAGLLGITLAPRLTLGTPCVAHPDAVTRRVRWAAGGAAHRGFPAFPNARHHAWRGQTAGGWPSPLLGGRSLWATWARSVVNRTLEGFRRPHPDSLAIWIQVSPWLPSQKPRSPD